MTLRFKVFGVELASLEIDLGDDGGQPATVQFTTKDTVVDRVSDYFTHRFIKRKLLP